MEGIWCISTSHLHHTPLGKASCRKPASRESEREKQTKGLVSSRLSQLPPAPLLLLRSGQYAVRQMRLQQSQRTTCREGG